MSENEEATQTTIFGIQIPTITFEKKIRFIVALIGLIATIVNTVTGISLPKYNVDCVEDMTFNVTSNVNGFLRNSPNFSTFIKSFTSILFDGYIIYAFVGWILYSKNFRFIITFILNIIVYQILKQFWEIRRPNGYYWDQTHFPSIFINYNPTTKTFYACELAILITAAFEWKRLGSNIFFWIGIALYVVEGFIMISFRAHFIIDIFSPGFLGHYLFILVEYYLQKILKNENIDIDNLKISKLPI
jgi:hypothetical protein